MTPRAAWTLAKQALSDYFEDKAPRLAAALAYYALMALAPLLLVCIAVAGLVVGVEDARAGVAEQAISLLGRQGGDFVEGMMDRASDGKAGKLGAAVAAVALLAGTGGVLVQLQDALNTVWEVKPKPHLPILRRIRNRLSVYGIVVAVAFMLLVSLALSAALSSLSHWNDSLPGHDAVWLVVDALVSLAVLTLLFAMLFQHVPDADIAWKDVWVGAAVTSVLFVVGKSLLGLYLGRPESTATFGSAGALIVVAVWVYYCSQIVLIGAEFTQAYAYREGSGIHPDEDAVAVTQEARAQQGLG